MYIHNDIDFEKDAIVESNPVCLMTNKYGKIFSLGILVKREFSSGESKGKKYYQFVLFWGKSPVNFNGRDYQILQQDYLFDLDLEMVADFRYCYCDYKPSPGLKVDTIQVSRSYRCGK